MKTNTNTNETMQQVVNLDKLSLEELYNLQDKISEIIQERKRNDKWEQFVRVMSDYMSLEENKKIELEIYDLLTKESTYFELDFDLLDLSQINKIKIYI